jgi:hypothetical protein
VFCFYPYREFKAIEYGNNPALRNYFEHNERNDREQPESNNAINKAKIMNEGVNYGNIAYD